MIKGLFGLAVVVRGFNEDYCGRKDLPEYPSPPEGKQVEKVHAFFRHGMRTDFQAHSCFPDNAMPDYQCSLHSEVRLQARGSSLLVKQYKSGCEIGQLVDYAEIQMERISEFLKNSYPSLLETNSMFLRSTDKVRTLGSLDLVVSNLWGEKRAAVHTEEFDTDPLTLSDKKCQRVNELNSQFPESKAFKKITSENAYFRDCQSMWNEEVGTQFNIAEAGDCLIAPQCAEVPLPNDLIPSKELYACVKNIYNELRQLKYMNWNEGSDFCPLATRPVWAELMEVSSKHPVSLWATHDDTIACMLSSMGLWDGVWPQYAALLVLEEMSDGSVRVIRDGKVVTQSNDGWKDLLPHYVFDKDMYETDCKVNPRTTEEGLSPYSNISLSKT